MKRRPRIRDGDIPPLAYIEYISTLAEVGNGVKALSTHFPHSAGWQEDGAFGRAINWIPEDIALDANAQVFRKRAAPSPTVVERRVHEPGMPPAWQVGQRREESHADMYTCIVPDAQRTPSNDDAVTWTREPDALADAVNPRRRWRPRQAPPSDASSQRCESTSSESWQSNADNDSSESADSPDVPPHRKRPSVPPCLAPSTSRDSSTPEPPLAVWWAPIMTPTLPRAQTPCRHPGVHPCKACTVKQSRPTRTL